MKWERPPMDAITRDALTHTLLEAAETKLGLGDAAKILAELIVRARDDGRREVYLRAVPYLSPAGLEKIREGMERDDAAEPVRTSDLVCTHCGLAYSKHAHTEHIDFNGEPYLNRLCSGRVVKL